MTNSQERGGNGNQSNGSGLSFDGWAVTLALVLAALIWAGVIKHIPW